MIDSPDYIVEQLAREKASLPSDRQEIQQHLIELGYISLLKANVVTENEILVAQDHFLADVRSSGYFQASELEAFQLQGKRYLVRRLLREVTDIDEGLCLDQLPREGTVNLASRIIHYRLDLFGLWSHAIDVKYSRINSLSQLQIIGEYAQVSPLEAINQLADIEGFTRRLLALYKEEQFILTFHSPNADRSIHSEELNRRTAFKNQLKEDFGDKSDFFIFLRKEVLKSREKKIDFNFLEKERLNPFKNFVVRLIQIHQWQDGFYSGLLDSDMGDLTLKSFLDAIQFYNQSRERDFIKAHRIIIHVGKGYFLFNALFFLQEYMLEDDPSSLDASQSKVLDVITHNLSEADDPTQVAFQENLEQLKSEVYESPDSAPKERNGLLQRIYYGIKRIVRKALRFAKRIFKWILEKAKKAWRFLKKLFTHLFEDLRNGIVAFADGLKFLLGKRIIQSSSHEGSIVSAFKMDGDSNHLVSLGAVPLISEHVQQVNYSVNAMSFALSIVGGVLKIVLHIVNALSWPMLLFTIIKVYKKISESFKKLEL